MTQNGGYTIEVDPDKLDELASGIGTAEMKCSFALSKLKWGMGSIAADIAGVGGGNINHLQEKFEGSIKKYKDLLDDSQAFVKKTAADVRQLDQSWQAKLGRTVGEFSGWYDLQRTFGEYDPQTGEKITGGQRAEAGVMTILNFSPGKAIGVFAKGGKMAKTAKIGQEASALGKINSGRKAVNPAVFKDFFSGAWNSMKGRFRSAKEYIVKGKEAVKRVRENIGNVKVPVGVRVADTGMGARMIVPEKRSLKELGQQFAVKSEGAGTKSVGNVPEGYRQDTNGRWHRPEGGYASNKEVGLPEPSGLTKRLEYMGSTPGKSSRTGTEVIERMRSEIPPKIRTKRNGKTLFMASDGAWYTLDKADMAHLTDAVSWWNSTGRHYGAKSPEVREWMLDPNNYVLDHYSLNRSAGAKLNETYLPPIK